MAITQSGKSRGSTRKSPAVAGAPSKAAPRKKRALASVPAITPQEWQQRVAAAAYLRAESRGFIGGSAEQDWFEAEAELMASLGRTPSA